MPRITKHAADSQPVILRFVNHLPRHRPKIQTATISAVDQHGNDVTQILLMHDTLTWTHDEVSFWLTGGSPGLIANLTVTANFDDAKTIFTEVFRVYVRD